jgi:hypothetical protein
MRMVSVAAKFMLIGSSAMAGPLNPPLGPVAPTYKTLSEVEPRGLISSLPITISQSGSYYLTGDLAGDSSSDAILIDAPNVTIDFNGFTLSLARRGVVIDPGASGVTIRNGRLSNCDGGVICLPTDKGDRASLVRVTDITVDGLSGDGLVLGPRAIVDQVIVSGTPANFNSGVSVGIASRVTNTTVDGVRGPGFALGEGTQASFCTASEINSGDGFFVDARVRVSDCTAININGNGFNTNPDQQGRNNIMSVVFLRCTASNVSQNGFLLLGNHGQVTDSLVSNIGFFSTFGGPQAGGVAIAGGGNRVENNRLFRVSYPVFLYPSSFGNSIVRNTAVTTQFGYTNQGTNNFLAPVGTNSSQVGAWDNSIQ